jgi:hypothetical protein
MSAAVAEVASRLAGGVIGGDPGPLGLTQAPEESCGLRRRLPCAPAADEDEAPDEFESPRVSEWDDMRVCVHQCVQLCMSN